MMRIFIIVLAVIFVISLIFYIFVSARMNAIAKRRKEEVMNSFNEKDRQIIRTYLDSLQVSMKDVFTFGKKNGRNKD